MADGTPVLWIPGSGSTTARLTFRVGVVDETLTTRGTTHLIEHLAHTHLGFPAYTTNAEVEALYTSFDVRGSSIEVGDHLRTLSTTLRDLPVENLIREIEILQLEARRHGRSGWDELRRTRHGLRGWGLLSTAELGLSDVRPEQLRAWTRRAFTADNAVLWVHGAQPLSSWLALPRGTRLPTPQPQVLPGRAAAWFSGPAGVVALTALGSEEPATLAAWWWLHRCLRQRLRGHDASVYDVDASLQVMAPGHLELGLSAQTSNERESDVVDAVQEVLEDVCAHEMPQQELDAWKRLHLERSHEDSHEGSHPAEGTAAGEKSTAIDATATAGTTAVQYLDTTARALLLDRETSPGRDWQRAGKDHEGQDPTGHEHLEQRQVLPAHALHPEDVRSALLELVDTTLLQIPAGTPPPMNLSPVPALSPPGGTRDRGTFGGHVFVAARHRPGGQRLIIGARGVLLEPAPTVQFAVAWEECVAILRHRDGRRDIVGEDATVLSFDPADWAQSSSAVQALDALAPADLILDLPGAPAALRRPPMVLSGLAAWSTSILVVLALAMGSFTAFMATISTGAVHPILAGVFVAVCAVLTAPFVVALVQRLRVPRQQRTTMATRARTHAAVAVDQALARGSRTLARNVAVGAWTTTAVSLLIGAWHGVAFWPAAFIASFAIRATREATRRQHR